MGEFDQVRWTVSGYRTDKPRMILSKDRWEMVRLLFGKSTQSIALYESDCAIPTRDVLANLKSCYPSAEIVWYCGADHFVPRERFCGKCDVLGFWYDGEKIFEKQEFLIISRRGIDMNALQLPRRHAILNVDVPEISSTEIRTRLEKGLDVEEFVDVEVAEYIREKNLY